MNFPFVIRQLGLLLLVLSLCLAAVAVWTLWHWAGAGIEQEKPAFQALVAVLLAGAGLGGALLWFCRGVGFQSMGRREALLLVALSWLLGAAFAGAPYLLWAHLNPDTPADHQFNSLASCYFEAMSGLTTTGATVLGGSTGHRIADLPGGMLLWRSLTHWLGGVGIVVLFVAVLPMLGVGGKRLFQVEAPGPQKIGVRPRIGETARILWVIYVGLTLAAILALRFCGLGWFDSVNHALSMVSTGGLSTRDASIGAFDSIAVDVVCMVFMFLAGVNFALYFRAVRGQFRVVWKDVELWVYLGLKIAVIAVITVNLVAAAEPIVTTAGGFVESSVGRALQYSAFQTIALHTGTGFATADYETWPFMSRALLIGLMFIGGCAGSTAGGVKVIRVWIAMKVMADALEKAFRPSVVRPLRLGSSTIDSEQRLAAVTYFLAIILLFGLGAFLLAIVEGGNPRCDFQTAMSATISTLCNVGPGLHGVGATQNYGWFSGSGKLLLSLLMCLGRLEVYAIFVLFMPTFWRQD